MKLRGGVARVCVYLADESVWKSARWALCVRSLTVAAQKPIWAFFWGHSAFMIPPQLESCATVGLKVRTASP
jgi:hypothetical protein